MPLEPRRVPAHTTEITYTVRGGRQVSIPLTTSDGRTVAHPASAADEAALDALGHTTVARSEIKKEATPAAETPATGGKE